jgi:hypothetical protein
MVSREELIPRAAEPGCFPDPGYHTDGNCVTPLRPKRRLRTAYAFERLMTRRRVNKEVILDD